MTARGIQVLLVEDNAGDARLLRELLVEAASVPQRFVHVERLAQALTRLKEQPFDVVLLDLTLPDASGLAGLRAIREAQPATAVVVLTGLSDEALAIDAMKSGAQDYLVKGEADPRTIARAIRYAVERSRLEEAARELLRTQTEHAAAAAERTRLQALFAQAPIAICVLTGPELVCEQANARYLQLVGKQGVVGKPLFGGVPELAGQGLDVLLRNVIRTGEPYLGVEHLVKLDRDGTGVLADAYIDFSYEPIRHADEPVTSVMVVATDVTDRVLSGQRVQAALDEQRRAIRSRDEVLATVSHDLRSPLSAISMAAELIEGAPEEAHALGAIRRSVDRMERLIRDLLDMASIENGSLSMTPAAHLTAELVDEAVEAHQRAALAREVSLVVENAAAAVAVRGDRDRVLQVFSNLLGNALKFTPSGGRIEIRAEAGEAGFVRFAIVDTGPGIEASQLPLVFDRFWQAKETARAGTGLGLAICKGIIEQHGGAIWVESQLGVGTTFYFTLPRTTSAR